MVETDAFKKESMILIEDTRQQAGKHRNVEAYCQRMGIEIRREKLPVGDYAMPDFTHKTPLPTLRHISLQLHLSTCPFSESIIPQIQAYDTSERGKSDKELGVRGLGVRSQGVEVGVLSWSWRVVGKVIFCFS